jgi:ornithine cyclodeaminase
MHDGDVMILRGNEITALLEGRELDLIQTVRRAYEVHDSGDSSLPHSTFLRFPDEARNRIIALPAYLGGEFQVAGMKWVSSFPGNLDLNLDRASAVVILNSASTGRPEAILEGSVISAKRTAASAALAALSLDETDSEHVGLIGCGLINFEVARFLQAARPKLKTFLLFDLDAARAKQFQAKCNEAFPQIEVKIAPDCDSVYETCALISFATTAIEPHVSDLSKCSRASTILHVSLRDLTAEVVLTSNNIVDDIDHVCRAQTSIHLAEQAVGNRDFIRGTLADVVQGKVPARDGRVAVFSPFGLGILDLAVAKLVRNLGLEDGHGTVTKSFLPDSWLERA